MKIGSKVIPKTPAGLELADVPVDGSFNQKRNVTCVLKGIATILEIKNVIIDYDAWGSDIKFKIGKIKYKDCLIECESGKGWAGAGALIKLKK